MSAPTFDPAEGTSLANFQVTVTCTTPSAIIRYTTNGMEPTIGDPVVPSGGWVSVRRSLTLKAKAWSRSGTVVSETTNGKFEITGEVATGGKHLLALKSSGEVFAWGYQDDGRLGNGSTASTSLLTSPVPSQKAANLPITNAVAVAAGMSHSVVLDNARKVWTYGSNTEGELGNNSSSSESVYAVQVVKSATPGDWLTDCVQVSAGKQFSGAVAASGHVYTWGSTDNGRLARTLASSSERKFAGRVQTSAYGNPELAGIAGIDLGHNFVLAREANDVEQPGSNGYVWGWGENDFGQLGNDGDAGYYLPQPIYATRIRLNWATYLMDAWEVSAGTNHSAIVRFKVDDEDLDKTVWTLGRRDDGRIGDNGPVTGYVQYPVKVVRKKEIPPLDPPVEPEVVEYEPLIGIIQVSAGDKHTLALDESGKVWAWGGNDSGELGDDTTEDRPYAVQVMGPSGVPKLTGIVRVSAGGLDDGVGFSSAVAKDGTVYVWGPNSNAQLSNGSTSGYSTRPVAVANLKLLPGYPAVTLAANVVQATAPGAATLTATPSHSDGLANLQKVEFFNQGVLVGTRTSAPWTISLASLAGGEHHAYAVATDLQGNSLMSLPADFSISGNADLDADGLLDLWELQWFGNVTSQFGTGDADGDKVTNANESLRGTGPTTTADSDGDGLSDDWETYWFSSLATQGSGDDPDGDKVSTLNEWTKNTNPTTAANTDNDGLADDWEIYWFGSLVTHTGATDPDSDKVTNADEWTKDTNPLSAANSDNDGLPDDWEIFWFGDVAPQIGAYDFDGDKVSNLREWTKNTNPTVSANSDNDGLADDWEMYWFNSLTSQTGASDADADKVMNLNEWLRGTDPTSAIDSDGDGLPDDWEFFWFGNITSQNAGGNPDGDALTNLQEWTQNGFPTGDNDNDGLMDAWEIQWFGNITSQNGSGDPDGDSLTNLQEWTLGTSPTASVNSDGDGFPDDWERYWFGGLTVISSAQGDMNNNGIRDAFELAPGSDPRADQSADTANRVDYHYSEMGRLTDADAKSYTFDNEGNLLSSSN